MISEKHNRYLYGFMVSIYPLVFGSIKNVPYLFESTEKLEINAL